MPTQVQTRRCRGSTGPRFGCPVWTLTLVAMLPALPARGAEFSRDVHHTVLARRALMRDAKLAPFNLGVKVRNRDALIWGTVPSAALAKLAENVLRAVPELGQVRSEVRVDADEALAILAVPAPPLVSLPRPESPALVAPPPQELPTIGGIAVPWAPSEAAPSRPVVAPAVLTVRAMLPRSSTPVWQPRVAPPPHLVAETILPTAAVLLAPQAGNSAEQAVRALHQSQARFHGIDVGISEGVVTLRGSANDAATHELARLIARVSGVERVILREE